MPRGSAHLSRMKTHPLKYLQALPVGIEEPEILQMDEGRLYSRTRGYVVLFLITLHLFPPKNYLPFRNPQDRGYFWLDSFLLRMSLNFMDIWRCRMLQAKVVKVIAIKAVFRPEAEVEFKDTAYLHYNFDDDSISTSLMQHLCWSISLEILILVNPSCKLHRPSFHYLLISWKNTNLPVF